MIKIVKRLLYVIVGVILVVGNTGIENVKAAKNVVVVIDPGHGGENMGTEYLPLAEKYYTLVIANYMKQELETYDNVTVYMTRTGDTNLSLEDRAVYAASVQADLVCSLHLNQSISHILYGAEVWIPCEGELYAQSYSFANEVMTELTSLGLYNRGIKTRVNKRDADYYGIIRNSTIRNIPSVIIEHCHVDHPMDARYYASQESLQALGVADATAVAKYFGLKSSKTGKDFSQYVPVAVPVPNDIVRQDATAPEIAVATLARLDVKTSKATFTLTATDSDGRIQSYRYSTNGGKTWSDLCPWISKTQSQEVTIPLQKSKMYSVVFEVYNQYDMEKATDALPVIMN